MMIVKHLPKIELEKKKGSVIPQNVFLKKGFTHEKKKGRKSFETVIEK
jgi:hypothetical protein